MFDALTDLLGTAWRMGTTAVGLSEWEAVASMLVGAVAYVLTWGVREAIRRRVADPLAGSTLLGILGLREEDERLKRGTVTKVFDGDTIEVSGCRVVRLIGIDAPEKSRNEKLVRDAEATGLAPEKIIEQGKRAQQWLERMLKDRTVELELDERTGRTDKYDRTLAHVWTVDEKGRRDALVSKMVVWAGHALPIGDEHNYAGQLQEARRMARTEGKGLNLGVMSYGPASSEKDNRSAGLPTQQRPEDIDEWRREQQRKRKKDELLLLEEKNSNEKTGDTDVQDSKSPENEEEDPGPDVVNPGWERPEKE